MCGICGIFHTDRAGPVDEAVVRRMTAKLRHRGPDEEGTVAGPGLALGHRRLAVIDLETGSQPMSDEAGRTIVHNGEVYNFRELRRDMEARGHVFRTRSDTEVVLHVFAEFDEETPGKLNGQFAFAIWDAPGRKLFLVRDRMGQKPLFYHHDGERFVFASSLDALIEAGGVPREIDPAALDCYLALGYVPAPRTIFRDVMKLSPGCTLTVKDGRLTKRRYWSVPPHAVDEHGKKRRLREELVALLSDAVRLRLVADVPLGAFLSGGIDSSIIVALMSELADDDVRTFAIGFDEALYDERTYAAEVARRFRTQHHEFQVTPECTEVLEQLVPLFGEPFADSSAIPTWDLSRETREHVKVALSGDGGDELFGGYDRYRAMRLGARWDRSPKLLRRFIRSLTAEGLTSAADQRSRKHRLRRFLSALEKDPVDRYIAWMSMFDSERRARLMHDNVCGSAGQDHLREAFARHVDGDDAERAMAVDLETYLPGDLLVKTDVASMAWGLEVRCPFLDHRLVAFARRLPTDMKLRARRGKRILRRAFRDRLPASILKRRKMGFGVPLGKWFRGKLNAMLRETLLARDASTRDVLNRDAVEALIDEHQAGRDDHSGRLYALVFLELWMKSSF